MQNMNDKSLVGGLTGTAITGAGAMFSATEFNTWLSIIMTIVGFFITILTTIIIPLCQKKKVSAEDYEKLKAEAEKTAEALEKAQKELEDLKNNGEVH